MVDQEKIGGASARPDEMLSGEQKGRAQAATASRPAEKQNSEEVSVVTDWLKKAIQAEISQRDMSLKDRIRNNLNAPLPPESIRDEFFDVIINPEKLPPVKEALLYLIYRGNIPSATAMAGKVPIEILESAEVKDAVLDAVARHPLWAKPLVELCNIPEDEVKPRVIKNISDYLSAYTRNFNGFPSGTGNFYFVYPLRLIQMYKLPKECEAYDMGPELNNIAHNLNLTTVRELGLVMRSIIDVSNSQGFWHGEQSLLTHYLEEGEPVQPDEPRAESLRKALLELFAEALQDTDAVSRDKLIQLLISMGKLRQDNQLRYLKSDGQEEEFNLEVEPGPILEQLADDYKKEYLSGKRSVGELLAHSIYILATLGKGADAILNRLAGIKLG